MDYGQSIDPQINITNLDLNTGLSCPHRQM